MATFIKPSSSSACVASQLHGPCPTSIACQAAKAGSTGRKVLVVSGKPLMGEQTTCVADEADCFPRPDARSDIGSTGQFMDGILVLDPQIRITAIDALAHDWFWTDPLPMSEK